jgi:NADH:ubiquinone oxidoreductase subunit 6 (subunit J)
VENFVFYLFVVLLLSALGIITFARNLVYAVWALLAALLCLVAFYAFLGADFVATTQLMIYVGGILVLLVFGLMFSGKTSSEKPIILVRNKQNIASALLVVLLVIILGKEIWQLPLQEVPASNEPTTSPLAVLLFSKYIFAFELAGILLLVALVGATLIAAKQKL